MEVKNLSDAYLGACHPQTCWRSMVELPPRPPFPPGGSLGTGGPGRAGTSGAEEHLPGWTSRGGASSAGAGAGRGGAAAAVRRGESEILAEAGREGVRLRRSSGGRRAEGRKVAGGERGGEAGAEGQGGRHQLGPRGDPAPGPRRAGTGRREPDPPGQVGEPAAPPPPQGLAEVHTACVGGGTGGLRTGSEETQAGTVEHTQPGCRAQPGTGPDPGEEGPVWRLGWGLQHLLKEKEQVDAADHLCWRTRC